MTNREAMGELLLDIERHGSDAYRQMVVRHIKCPYLFSDGRGKCAAGQKPVDRLAANEVCLSCKEEWLDKEVRK